MRKSIWNYPLIIKGFKNPMPQRYRGPYLISAWRVLLMPVLVSPNFTIGRMMCLHSSLFSVMEEKGFNAFRDLFCWILPNIIGVSQVVAFLWIYLTWLLLLPYGARYIPNMHIASFAWRYCSGTYMFQNFSGSRFVQFHWPCLQSW